MTLPQNQSQRFEAMVAALSDNEILGSGSERDFRVLYDRYWMGLYQKAIARLGNSQDAEDLIQDIFVTLWRNRSTIIVEDTLKPYLFTALKYAIIKKVQRDYTKGRVYPLNMGDIEKITLGSDELVYYKQLEQLIETEVARLPQRMQEVYRLSRNEQLKNSEIAARLQISEQTVKNILSESLKRLRVSLSDFKFAMFLL